MQTNPLNMKSQESREERMVIKEYSTDGCTIIGIEHRMNLTSSC